MKFNKKYWKFPAVFVFSLFLLPSVTQAQHYKQTNLVSNIAGMATTFDPNLKNPWGLTRSSGSPWWVANNNSGTSTLYGGTGNIVPLVVTVPPPNGSPAGTADRMPSSSLTTPITAPRMALSTKAQPPAKSMTTNFYM